MMAISLVRCLLPQYHDPMKLKQGQVWKTDARFIRIVRLERLSVGYKSMATIDDTEGSHHDTTKKEFCRLIKGAELVDANERG